MSWSSRRQTTFLGGVVLFLLIFVGIPVAIWLYEPPTCFDGKQNQEETAPDKGGPCGLLDERSLVPHAVLWSRSFPVRDGLYGAVAYIENPNSDAGVREIEYNFGLYDDRNVLVAERTGSTYILPGGITPIFEGGIVTGNRTVARTYFELLDPPVWERLWNPTEVFSVFNKKVSDTGTTPRISADVKNESVDDYTDVSFVAVVFDTAGNAIAASKTLLARSPAGETREVVFTWPDPFTFAVGRVDVLPLLPPEEIKAD